MAICRFAAAITTPWRLCHYALRDAITPERYLFRLRAILPLSAIADDDSADIIAADFSRARCLRRHYAAYERYCRRYALLMTLSMLRRILRLYMMPLPDYYDIAPLLCHDVTLFTLLYAIAPHYAAAIYAASIYFHYAVFIDITPLSY